MAPDYKGLNLRRDEIDQYLSVFVAHNSLVLRSTELLDNNKKKRITIGRVGTEDAIIDLHLNNDGTTTVQYKIGKNQEQGQLLAQHFYSTIDPGEFITVNYSLVGISSEDIEPIFDELCFCVDDNGNREFEFNVEQDEPIRKLVRVRSIANQDTITVTHFKTTNKLTIQGKPLFSYRRIIYLMTELLDLSGLQAVLSRTEENTAAIVRIEVARDYLKTQLSESFDSLPSTIQSLLISGCCVKLASPRLPEYSMLLFPDLRALEGVLRTVLCSFGMYPDQEEHNFGAFFDVNKSKGVAKFKSSYIINNVEISNVVQPMENAYTFFRKHRHTLFHMNDFADASRKIDTLEKALSLSKDVYGLLNDIYRAINTKS
ncbi:MAG: type II toxin-antitoxin system RnlA family toxin [Methylococcaceae bacterium]